MDLRYHTFLLLVVVLVLLAILVMIYANNSVYSFDKFPNSWNNIHTLMIVHAGGVCDINLEKYCNAWNYSHSVDVTSTGIATAADNSDYTLFLYDNITNINYSQSLTDIINLSSNTEYIAFYNCNDYIIKNGSKLTHEQIFQEIKDIDIPDTILSGILYEGFPYITRNGLILHRGYIDKVFRNQPYPFRIPSIISSFIPRRRTNIVENSKIPKIIHQTFQTRLLPNHISKAVTAWLDHNHDYDYYYYDDHDRRRFIEENFDSKVVNAYDTLIPGAYRADLWRYCVIYVKGGVYIDIKMGPLLSLSNIIDDDSDLVIVNDTHYGTLYNAFFAASPRHPAILKVIETVVERVLEKQYGNHILYPTGPLAMGHAILSLLGYNGHAPNGKHDTIFGKVQVYSHITKNNQTNIVNENNEEIIKTRYSRPFREEEYLHKITGAPHYRFLWEQRAIYR